MKILLDDISGEVFMHCQPMLEKNPLKIPDFKLQIPESFSAENPI
jgi:hypothetical protein